MLREDNPAAAAMPKAVYRATRLALDVGVDQAAIIGSLDPKARAASNVG